MRRIRLRCRTDAGQRKGESPLKFARPFRSTRHLYRFFPWYRDPKYRNIEEDYFLRKLRLHFEKFQVFSQISLIFIISSVIIIIVGRYSKIVLKNTY